jgi:hypothetical protein
LPGARLKLAMMNADLIHKLNPDKTILKMHGRHRVGRIDQFPGLQVDHGFRPGTGILAG